MFKECFASWYKVMQSNMSARDALVEDGKRARVRFTKPLKVSTVQVASQSLVVLNLDATGSF
jgi:hypothetical protein